MLVNDLRLYSFHVIDSLVMGACSNTVVCVDSDVGDASHEQSQRDKIRACDEAH